jgi:methylenetetrahydrofolate--tRNA-(uracil-5-)-methyltransferase
MRGRPHLLFAGQMSGVEGYVESAASGLIAGRSAAALALGGTPSAPPRVTAIGALGYYVSHAEPTHYQPTNITWGIMPPLEPVPRDRGLRKQRMAERALDALEQWMRLERDAGRAVCGAAIHS